MSSSATKRISRSEWVLQVAGDRHFPRLTLHVALAFSTWCDAEGAGWRPQQLLADDIGASRNAVQTALDALVERGHLVLVSEGRGRGHASRYQMQKRPTQIGNIEAEKGQPQLAVSAAKRPTAVNEKANGGADKRPTQLGKSLDQKLEKKSEVESISLDLDADFEIFWQQYPRKVAKGYARKAYAAARKKIKAATILQGVLRYSAERQGEPERYTKHPATWLNAEGWADEPAAPNRSTGNTLADAIARQRSMLDVEFDQ